MEEANWMKKISSEGMCTYYYALFIINAISSVIGIFGMFLMFRNMPAGSNMLMNIVTVLLMLLAIALPIFNSLFLFMLCNRALLTHRPQEAKSL